MIELTCSACGIANRIAEGDVPTGAKFVTCSSCKARVALPASNGGAPPLKPAGPALPSAPRPKTPPPVPMASSNQRGGDLADLPAPKRSSPLAGLDPARPAPKSGLDLADLPAPKSTVSKGTSPINLEDLMPVDLPAPKAKSAGITDLPAPKAKAPVPPIAPPATPRAAGIADLPAPKAKSPGIIDLPAPKGPPVISDLPTPKVKPAAAAAVAELDLVDLPAPKGISDLPTPKVPAGHVDLPAPKGFFDDLPQPKSNTAAKPSTELAPKGFFDDVATPPAKQDAGSIDLPAPKGFFDDLPQPKSSTASTASTDLAPKGFFDDLPQPALTKPAAPAAKPGAKQDGFFDDLPEPPKGASAVFDDLQMAPADGFGAAGDLELAAPGGAAPLELDLAGAGPELDLGLPVRAPAKPETKSESYGDLDLSAPVAPPPPVVKSGISIKASSSPAAKPKDGSALSQLPSKSEIKLDLEDESERTPAAKEAKRDAPKRKAAAEAAATSSKRRPKLIAGAVLGVALLGGGGFYMYKRHADKVAHQQQIDEQLELARGAIHEATPNHWARAATAAGTVLETDPDQLDALGLRAEALLAGAFDTGVGGEGKIAQGRAVLASAVEAGVTGPQLETAQALGLIAANQPDRAVTKLQAMTAREPKNGFWQLYLGWALVAKSDPAAAVKAFDAAIAADPKVKLPALYARGRAKLQLADLDGAKADFAAVLDSAKDHIGAQVGLAAALPAAQSSQRETDLLAILARKDVATGDPRAVVQAHTLLGDGARIAGRNDVAREQYTQALALAKLDVPSLVGLAQVELRDSRVDLAADLVQKALSQAPDNVDANLVAAELAIRQGKAQAAAEIAQKLVAHVPPLPPLQHAHLQIVLGNLADAQGKDEDALAAWIEGAKLAGDLDLAPMMAAVTKLGALAKHATENHDDKAAADYNARADQLLSSLADRAQDDAALAKTIGTAYLQAGNAAKAVTYLQRAVDMRGNDVDAHLELAKALTKLGKTDDALAQLDAALKLDPSRLDVALEIARTLELAKRTEDAAAAYAKLLSSSKDVPLQARIHAGRFFARNSDIKRAAEQGDAILLADPANPAGHYLRGEGLIVAGKLDDARKELTLAVDSDPDPQYFDAQGRAAEASLKASSDSKYQDSALRAYERALLVAPEMFNPQAGTGRIHILRKEWTQALPALTAANQIDSKNTEVLFNLGVVAQNLGQPAVAIQYLTLATRGSTPSAEAYWRLGQLYDDANNSSKTIDSLRAATRLASEQQTKTGAKFDWLGEAWYKLGDTESKIGDLRAAKAAFEQYVGTNPPPSTRLDEVNRRLRTDLKNL